jgi:hypothetical protein
MKNLKDKLIKESESFDSAYEKYVEIDKAMISMVVVSKNESNRGFLFQNPKAIKFLYEDWGGYGNDEIESICNDIDHLKKNESLVHISSKEKYEIITVLK